MVSGRPIALELRYSGNTPEIARQPPPGAGHQTAKETAVQARGVDQAAGAAASWIEWHGPGGSGRRPLDRPLRIGRDTGCDICIADPSVSRTHAVISAAAGHVLVDAGRSKNGISLAGTRVPRATILPGQPFVIGGTTFTVVPMSGAQPQDARQTGQQARPAAGANHTGIALGLVLGAIILAVIAGAGLLFMNSGKSSPGGITFSPSNLSCSSPVDFTTTVGLPSSVTAGDTLSFNFDGKLQSAEIIRSDSGWTHQTDGSWENVSTINAGAMESICQSDGLELNWAVLTTGTHTEQYVDMSGHVLAEGTYTVQ
jgi:hypothetical protein